MLDLRRPTSRVIAQVVLTILVLPFVFPLISMLQGAFAGLGWGNFAAVLSVPGFGLFFVNSALIALGSIVLVLLCALTASFGFAKLGIRGKEVYFWAILACLTLPEVVLIAPLFATVTALGASNTLWAVIIPTAALHIPFAVLLARNFVDGVPDELMEAARVDGATTFRVFWHIILPLTRPIVAAIVVLVFIAAWNDYLLPLLFLQQPEVQTVTLVPQHFSGLYSIDQTKILAAAVLTALPVVILYISAQRFFERGLSAGALK